MSILSGGRRFTVGAPDRAITSTPDGGWTVIPWPHSNYYNGKTYFGFVNGSSGAIYAASYDHYTGTVVTTSLDDLGTPDTHDSPSVLVRDSDKKLIYAYSRHDGSTAYIRVSSSAQSVSAFAAHVDLDASLGGTDYTYMSLVQLLSETSDPIYLLYRDISGGSTGRLAYSTSTDGGSTWAAQTVLITGASGKIPYWSIDDNGLDRMDFAFADKDPYNLGSPSGIYHGYWYGGTMHQSDATTVSAGSQPTALTQVYDGADGPSFPFGVATDDTGAPVILIAVLISAGAEVSMRYARYSSGAWTVTEIAQVGGAYGGGLPADAYGSSGALDRVTPNVAYFSKKVSGVYQLWRYETADHGATWSGVQVTSSGTDTIFHRTPKNRAPDLRCFSLRGTFTDPTSNSLAVITTRS